MTLKQYYEAVNGDLFGYNAVMQRLGKEERIIRLLNILKNDTNADELTAAIAQEDAVTAYRAIHSLKGVGLNLGLTRLCNASVALLEAFRENGPEAEFFRPETLASEALTPDIRQKASLLSQTFYHITDLISEIDL